MQAFIASQQSKFAPNQLNFFTTAPLPICDLKQQVHQFLLQATPFCSTSNAAAQFFLLCIEYHIPVSHTVFLQHFPEAREELILLLQKQAHVPQNNDNDAYWYLKQERIVFVLADLTQQSVLLKQIDVLENANFTQCMSQQLNASTISTTNMSLEWKYKETKILATAPMKLALSR